MKEITQGKEIVLNITSDLLLCCVPFMIALMENTRTILGDAATVGVMG